MALLRNKAKHIELSLHPKIPMHILHKYGSIACVYRALWYMHRNLWMQRHVNMFDFVAYLYRGLLRMYIGLFYVCIGLFGCRDISMICMALMRMYIGYILTCLYIQRFLCIYQRALYTYAIERDLHTSTKQKSPTHPQKSPTYPQQSPIYLKICPGYLKI